MNELREEVNAALLRAMCASKGGNWDQAVLFVSDARMTNKEDKVCMAKFKMDLNGEITFIRMNYIHGTDLSVVMNNLSRKVQLI